MAANSGCGCLAVLAAWCAAVLSASVAVLAFWVVCFSLGVMFIVWLARLVARKVREDALKERAEVKVVELSSDVAPVVVVREKSDEEKYGPK